MIKKVLVIFLVFALLYMVGVFSHQKILGNEVLSLPFSLEKLYLFHAGFSILICVNLQLLSTVNNIFEQLGFIYLAFLLLKIILFSVIFYASVINGEKLSQIAKFSLLIPTFIFLLTEVFFVVKILNKKQ